MIRLGLIMATAITPNAEEATQQPEHVDVPNYDDLKTFDPTGLYIYGGLSTTTMVGLMGWTIKETHKNSKRIAVLNNEVKHISKNVDENKEGLRIQEIYKNREVK